MRSYAQHIYGSMLVSVMQTANAIQLTARTVCINQSDLAERSIQVSLMSRLFHRATAVIVWLGSFRDKRRTELRAWAANIMNDMAEEGDMAEEEVSRDRLIRDDKWKSFKTDKYKFIENPEYRVFWEGFDFLLSANWFQRIWTFSEAVLSSQLIMCGPGFTFDMDRWFDLTDTLHTHRSSYSQQLRGSMGDIAIAGTQSTYRISRLKGKRGYTTLDLLELMQVTEIYHATDKRDLIYGLLTLETRDRSKDIVPRPEADYTKPLSEVYTEFARYWLSNDFEIPFFNICFDPSVDFPAETTTVPSTAQSIIPTWVPDWSRSGHRRGLIYIPQDMMERLGCTGSRKYLDTSYPIHATHSPLRFLNKELLALRGLKFDRIKLISKAHGTVIRDPHEKDWFEFYSTSEHLAKSSSAKDTHQSRLRKEIWKLIIMERSLRTFNLDTIHAKSPIRTNDSVYNAFLQCLDLDHLFLTERGYIGCGIECAKEGDEIFFAYGTIMAFIIRRVGSKGEEDAAPEVGPKEKVDVEREELRGEKGEGKNATKAGIDKLPKDIYEIVDGSAYIHGLMNGGAIKIAKREGLGAEDVWFC